MSIFRKGEPKAQSVAYEAGAVALALIIVAGTAFLVAHVIMFVIRSVGGAL